MKNKNIIFLSLLLFFSFAFFHLAQAAIVPCGGAKDPCTLCHLFTGIKNLVDWGLAILVTVAIVCIVLAGIMYMLAGGSESAMTTAKNFMKSSLIGFTVVLAAWLIVFTVGWLFSSKINFIMNCDKKSSVGTTAPAADQPGQQDLSKTNCEKWCTDAQGDQAWTISCKQGCQENGQRTATTGEGLSQSAAQSELDACGVKYASAYSLTGLRDTTLAEACSFKDASGCSPQITPHGGTNGNHASGTYSHANGYKLDYGINSCLDNYIQGNYTYGGVRSDGAKMYQSGSGACYAREGDHWDVSTAPCPPARH